MPLLRLKPFKPEVPPAHLTAEDEVFLCELTGEVFTDYEAFYQRMILCNSLVWSCSISNKVNLTYKEALDSEKAIRKSLNAIPYNLKLGMLYCVHHTRRSKIQDLTDDIYEYFKTRFQMDEKVEVKLNDKWTEAIISELPYSVDIVLQNKLNNQKPITPLNSPSKEKLKAFDGPIRRRVTLFTPSEMTGLSYFVNEPLCSSLEVFFNQHLYPEFQKDHPKAHFPYP